MSLQNATDTLATLVSRGHAALAAGDLQGARTCFEEAASTFADQPEAHNNLGALYMGIGEYGLAATCFAKAAAMLPERPNVRFNLGVAHIHLGEADAAVADFQAVLALAPEDAEAYNDLAVAHHLAGRHQDARAAIDAALSVQPNFPNAVLNLCDIEVAAGDLERAISHCEEYLSHFRDSAVSRQLLVLLDQRAWQALEAAIPRAEALVADDAQDLAARRHLGRLLEARKALSAEA